jgi:acetyl-CoA carboxylase beta subunit
MTTHANCPSCQSHSRISALSFAAEPLPAGNTVRLWARCAACDTYYQHDFQIDSGVDLAALQFDVQSAPDDNSVIRVKATLEDEDGRAYVYDFSFVKAWGENDGSLIWSLPP